MSGKRKRGKPVAVVLIDIFHWVIILCFVFGLLVFMVCIGAGILEPPKWILELPEWIEGVLIFVGMSILCGLIYLLIVFPEKLKEHYLKKAGYSKGAVQSTFKESMQNEQVEDMRMTLAKDPDNQVAVHFPIWLRVFGGIGSLGFGALSYALAQDMRKDTTLLVLFIVVGLPLTFLCIFLLGYTSQFIFDHTLGNMTIRSSIGPFIYRSRRFSRKQLLSAWPSEETSEGTPQAPSVTLWRVSLEISGRKKDLNIIVNNEKRANYLANRIKAFIME